MTIDFCPGCIPRDERYFGNGVADNIAVFFMELPEVKGCCSINVVKDIRETRYGVEFRTGDAMKRMYEGVIDGLGEKEEYSLHRKSDDGNNHGVSSWVR